MAHVSTVRLTKHHGLGNDFLVARNPSVALGPEHARRWCDRRRGIGADGLLVLVAPDRFADVTDDDAPLPSMVLFNADGSRAEMSGNGIRCLAQAHHRALHEATGSMTMARRSNATYTFATDAGVRRVDVMATEDPDTILATVSMGAAVPIDEPRGWASLECDPLRPVMHLSLGNPHSVVGVDDVHDVPLAELGALVPQVNLEVIHPGPESFAVTMRVHERGAGITEACGTGATASAYAARRWGLVDIDAAEIVVHMDGGDVTVRISDELHLTGPAAFIATIDVPA